MNWQATEEEIESLYRELLPEGSRGREATNPLAFHRYFNDTSLSIWMVPSITLIEFEVDGHIEWIYVCDRVHEHQILRPKLRPWAEYQVSGHHFQHQFIRMIETIDHGSRSHHFLEDLTTFNPYLSMEHVWSR